MAKNITHGKATVVFCDRSGCWVGLAQRAGGTWRAPAFSSFKAAKRYAELLDAEICRHTQPQ